MDNIKSVIVSAVVALLVAGGLIGLMRAEPAPAPVAGALAGPDIPSPYLSWGNVRQWSAFNTFQSATTTICVVQSPVGTSTLLSAALSITNGTTTSALFDISTSSTPYASSTPGFVVAASVASGALGTIAWQPGNASTSPGVLGNDDWKTTGESPFVLGPSTYITFKTEGAGLGGYTYGGTCQARFEQVAR